MDEFGAEISADLEIKSLGQFIKISGSAQGKLKLICDRCLHEYDYDLEIVAVERFDENMNEYEDITSYLNIESLSEWLDYAMDWDELYDNRRF